MTAVAVQRRSYIIVLCSRLSKVGWSGISLLSGSSSAGLTMFLVNTEAVRGSVIK